MAENDIYHGLEAELNDFAPERRAAALKTLAGHAGEAPESKALNMHCHTFFSYNGRAMSPSAVAWWAKASRLFAVGIVDFDVLEGLDEFLSAADALDLRAVVGLETRVYVHELADKEINSPGEPGVAYHMGVGFVTSDLPGKNKPFLARLKNGSFARTVSIIKKVNPKLDPVQVHFKEDIAILTPSGNATERHVCQAYDAKARALFPDRTQLAEYWADRLAMPLDKVLESIGDPVAFQGVIRAKTMKMGGIGYIEPKPESFPSLVDINKFLIDSGAIPCVAWLNGESAAESDPDALLDLHIRHGAAMVNIIPDRNHNFADPAVRARKVAELNRFIEAAKRRSLPILVGTEMNAPGQRMLDDFASDALAPHWEEFVRGAAIACAHNSLQKHGFGYLSKWAVEHFPNLSERNAFFVKFGTAFRASNAVRLSNLWQAPDPEQMLACLDS